MNSEDTFTLIEGVYRFYLTIKIKEFKETGLVSISVKIRDIDTLHEYTNFDFSSVVSSEGGD
jgi:hypothetical protein